MKLLILSRYGRLGASSRLRMMQYQEAFEAAGICVEILPFFDDDYLRKLYLKKADYAGICKYYLKRVYSILSTEKPDVIWLEKEVLPWLPAFIENFLLPRRVPIVSDYDDAVFHRYDRHTNPVVRNILGNKIDHIMRRSALVMAGNPYLASRAVHAGAKRVEIVPTVVDEQVYSVTPELALDGRLRIGWIGTPSTWNEYMVPMRNMLFDLAQEHDAVLRVVGAGVPNDVMMESFAWSEESESILIQGMDIGLMPLNDSPWSLGKCGYKLIQYMACGLPVIATPVGVNVDIVENGVTGFLVRNHGEWRYAVKTLLSDPNLRRRMGAAGRKRMEERYSLRKWGSKVASLLHEIAAR